MSKKNKSDKLYQAEIKPSRSEFVLDEGFIMCASGHGCESKNCKGTNLDCEFMALRSLVEAFTRKYLLVVDDQYKIRNFYSVKVKQGKFDKTIKTLIFKWLDGRGEKVRKYSVQPLPQKIVDNCPTATKEKKLDGLLCQLALASKAPIWSVDSDFDCVHKIEPIIIYMDPVDVYTDMFPSDAKVEKNH